MSFDDSTPVGASNDLCRLLITCRLPSVYGSLQPRTTNSLKSMHSTILMLPLRRKRCSCWQYLRQVRLSQGADPELVSRGAESMSSTSPLPSPFLPSLPPSLPCPFPSLPSLPYPSTPSFTSIFPPSPFPPLPLKRGVRGPPLENFEIVDCCRWVLAHSGMQKGVCKCVCFRSRYIFGPSPGGGDPPRGSAAGLSSLFMPLKTMAWIFRCKGVRTTYLHPCCTTRKQYYCMKSK